MKNNLKRAVVNAIFIIILSGVTPAMLCMAGDIDTKTEPPLISGELEGIVPENGYHIENKETAKRNAKQSREAVTYDEGNYQAELKDGVLTVTGSGAIAAYNIGEAPWYTQSDYIQSIVISSGITSIGKTAFQNCKALTGVTFSNTLTTIGEAAFYGCSALSEVVLPASLIKLERGAFADCTGLVSVKLNNNLQTIESYVFQNTKMKSLAIPALVTSLDPLAFYGNAELADLTVDSENSVYTAENGILYSKAMDSLYYYAKGGTQEVMIPNTVTSIGSSAFQDAKRLTSVHIPNSVISIGDWAFYGCSALVEIEIPDSVTGIGNGILENCTALKKAVVGNGTSVISYRMFMGCCDLIEIIIGDNVKEIENRAFVECTSLKSIMIPEGVVHIKTAAFYGCTALENVTLPSTLEEIRYQGFSGCESLTALIIPASVTLIENTAFDNCLNLKLEFLGNMEKLEDGSYRILDKFLIKGTRCYTDAYEVLAIVNAEREKEGLSALVMDKDLLDAAMVRAAEIQLDFSHDRPTGDDCFTVLDKAWAENIAAGNRSASGTMNQWMNSAGHRANIMTASFKSIGIGCFTQGSVKYWVQLFGVEEAEGSGQLADQTVTETVKIKPDAYTFDITGSTNEVKQYDTLPLEVKVINPGWSYQYTKVMPESFQWSSSDSSIATVSSNGIVKGMKKGKAAITCKSKNTGKNKSFKNITVISNTIEKITLSKKTAKIAMGKTLKLNTDIIPSAFKNEKIKWKSSNTNVATVNANGKITAKKYGKAVITVTALANSKIKAQCIVTVIPKKAVIKECKVSKNKVILTWSKVNKASGYEIYKAVSKSGPYKKVKTVKKESTVKAVIKGLQKGKHYYFKIRAYAKTNSGKIYGNYSKVKRS